MFLRDNMKMERVATHSMCAKSTNNPIQVNTPAAELYLFCVQQLLFGHGNDMIKILSK